MGWEAAFITWLQSFSSPPLDYIIYFFTLFGDRLFFILVLTMLYWCVDKNFGFKFFNVYLFGSMTNEGIKYIFQRPRPYVKYGEKIKSIIKDTKGFSFPSGHSQSIANISTQTLEIIKNKKKKILPYVCIFAIGITLVMFSRMYLGQHYFTDVLFGAFLGLVTAILFGKIYDIVIYKYRYKYVLALLPIYVLIAVIMICLQSKVATEVCGAFSGFSLGYYLENKYLKYNVRADKRCKYIMRYLLGIAVAVIFKIAINLLSALANVVWINILLDGFLSYFIITLWISFFAPLVFSIFGI